MGLFFGGRRGVFDPPVIYGTPGIGDGIPGNRPIADTFPGTWGEGEPGPLWQGDMPNVATPDLSGLPPPIMEGRKGGGFGEVLKALAGGVLDGVATHYGAEPGYAGARAARERALAALAERQAALQDYEAKKGIDQRYSNPPTDDTYEVIKRELGPEAANKYLLRKGDPTVTTTLPGDRFYSGPASELPNALGSTFGGGQPSTGGLPTVTDEATYQAVPNGAKYMTPDGSIRVKGGGSGNATGGFPR